MPRRILGAFARFAALTSLSAAVFSQTTPDTAIIHGGTHVVLVNVVVTDKHGRPVSGLTRQDFTLLDNGQPQPISLFSQEQPDVTADAARSATQKLTFTNRPAANGGAVVAFLFDQLNTKLTDQELAKKDFLQYLRNLPANSRVAVFILGDSLALLHDFSEDLATLLAELEKHHGRVNPEVDAATAPPASSNSLTGEQSTTALWDSFLQSSNQPYIDYTETVRATRTAAALETIAGHLEGIPGRKTLIWISGGFPIQLGLHRSVDEIPQGNANNRASAGSGSGKGGGRRAGMNQSMPTSSTQQAANLTNTQSPGSDTSFVNDVERAIRALNESDVAVYPVDARGVTTPAAFGADRSSIGRRGRGGKAFGPPDYNYETLETLAEETGGRPFHHINDLSSAIQEAAGDARVSYTLGFAPAAANLDGSYHRIEVTAGRSDLKTRYRPGYVASPDRAVTPTLADAITNPVALAGIGFSVHLEPVEGGYRASVTIDAHNITLVPKDGKWIGSLQFLVVVGKVEQLTTIPISLNEATYHQVEEKGLSLGARVKTPPGTPGFNIGFRDIPSGLVGTLHVSL